MAHRTIGSLLSGISVQSTDASHKPGSVEEFSGTESSFLSDIEYLNPLNETNKINKFEHKFIEEVLCLQNCLKFDYLTEELITESIGNLLNSL